MILLVLAIILFIRNDRTNNHENFINYTQCSKILLSKRLEDFFSTNKIKKNDKDWDLYVPCGYTYVEDELQKIEKINKNQKVFAIDGCDKIVSKYHIYRTLLDNLGESYTNYFPKTYPFTKDGVKRLIDNHTSGMKYIAKKDVQRQEGLKIIHKIKELSKF